MIRTNIYDNYEKLPIKQSIDFKISSRYPNSKNNARKMCFIEQCSVKVSRF